MNRTYYLIAIVTAASLVGGCKKKASTEPSKGSAAEPAATGSAGSGGVTEGSGKGSAAAGSGSAEGSGSGASGPTTVTEALSTPESVLYDAAEDRYIVSNINGAPAAADDNGFLTVITPDGAASRWIDGAKPDVKLDAPKGMAISGDLLWVADITAVRRFDLKTGAQKDDVKIKGAAFLNDVTSDGSGGVYVTDSGLDANLKPNGADAVYHIAKDGKLTTTVKDKGLGAPNGITMGAGGMLEVVTFGSGELYGLDAKGAKQSPTKLPTGQLDGVVAIDGGDMLVSSWEGKCVYRGRPGAAWKKVVSDVESPADIGWDSKRHRLLIPSFMQSKVIIHAL